MTSPHAAVRCVPTSHFQPDYVYVPPNCFYRINAVGVDIAPFSAMKGEEEVLLLPGLPLMNLPGENIEDGMWSFNVETARGSLTSADNNSAPAMIDYVHPGASCVRMLLIATALLDVIASQYTSFATQKQCWSRVHSDWNSTFRDESWRRFPHISVHDENISVSTHDAIPTDLSI